MKGFLRVVTISFVSLTSTLMAETAQLRSLVDEWVGVMEKTHQEKSRWTREREILESAKEGLRTEIADLKEKIQTARVQEQTAEKEDQDKIELKRGYDTARSDLAAGLQEVLPMMPRLIALIPESFRQENTKLSAAISSYKELVTLEPDKSLGKKLNTIITILGELETFQTKIWTVQETRKVGGDSRIVTTAYLGLGAAYSADENGEVALRGHPTEQGWVFTELDGKAAEEINALITTATGAGEIELSTLPALLK